MEIFFQLETYIALLTLTIIEIILGIDNIIFISIVTNKVKKESRNKARITGLLLALVLRIVMLFGLTWFIGLTKPIFYEFSIKDLILLLGGGFLIFKSVIEISHKINGNFDEKIETTESVSMKSIIWQIVAIDFVFSVDSILTAIGLTEVLLIMVIAVIISILFMIIYSSKISDIIDRYPSLEILALCFLILIGFTLILEAAHIEIPKGFIYFALFFTLGVELVNIRFRRVSLKRIKIKK
ncbi:MAG: TerC family protein [Bacteroidota bacterium]|jgi:predicted tellurium resistance membrane protein TerC|nr:TerC family protein [Bacteroidota bacterium]MEC7850868.1 TerC family protein [Bacteroidota bacterium]MEC8679189.1 TerC family protein [Bacteroidota bacterium]MEC8702154.1 TerC family protein [Bacteroidota bacterium]|tara:strand:- start:1325 stop:2044 length:720 start_codon:yes stop_codon:yes gene_type:complete